MSVIQAGLVQMDIAYGDPGRNRIKAEQLIGEAVRRGASLVVLPELWTTGGDLKRAADLAEDWNGESVRLMRRLALEHRLYIVAGSFAELAPTGVYNTSFVVSPTGQVLTIYRKVHLFPLMGEDRCFQGGQSLTVADTGLARVGLSICYDVRFPEVYRCLAAAGARVITIAADFPRPREEHWVTLCRARAIENQVFVLAVNRVGSDPRNSFFGRTMAIDPWGEVILEADDQEQVLLAEIKLALVNEARGRIPVWEDRRPQAYHLHRGAGEP